LGERVDDDDKENSKEMDKENVINPIKSKSKSSNYDEKSD